MLPLYIGPGSDKPAVETNNQDDIQLNVNECYCTNIPLESNACYDCTTTGAGVTIPANADARITTRGLNSDGATPMEGDPIYTEIDEKSAEQNREEYDYI